MAPAVGKLLKFIGWEPLTVVLASVVQCRRSLGEAWELGFLSASFLVVPLMFIHSQELSYQLVKSLAKSLPK